MCVLLVIFPGVHGLNFTGANSTVLLIPDCELYHNKSMVMLVFPGGAYRSLSTKNEGSTVCAFLAKQGFCCYVVHYTVNPTDRRMPLWDGEAAIEYVHKHHPWSSICLVGFSAGGHAVGVLAMYGRHTVQAVVMAYPVVTFQPNLTHLPSTVYLLGHEGAADSDLLDYYSLERHVTACYPPTFLFHSRDDRTVAVENSEIMAAALARENVSHEIHLFPTGGHGYRV